MADVKTLFEQDSEYRYEPGMVKELRYTEKIRYISPDFMERVLTAGGFTDTDHFYLLGVLFFRMATAQMVTDFIRYYRTYYGTEECEKLLMGSVASTKENPLTGEQEIQESTKIVRDRLIKLAKKHVLFAFDVKNVDVEDDMISSNFQTGGGYRVPIFCANYQTFSIVKSFFGDWPVFEKYAIAYNTYYCETPVQKMMETLHACRVGVMGFMNRRPGVQIVREESFVFGSNRERYTPTMLVRVPTSECMYHVIVEPIHYSVDERILPKSKHLENVENLIETMNRLVNHYDYMQRTYQKKEEVRFLIAAENLKGMNTAVRMMNKYCRNFNQRVFFTSDTVLSAVGNLEKSVIMAKEVKDAETQESHLGLVRPKHETLQQKNSWIFEIPG